MNLSEFNKYWQLNYPNSLPFGYDLKLNYPQNWFRIHNLPKSKRYADTNEEYQMILNRQNRLITDVIGSKTDIILLLNISKTDLTNKNYRNYLDFKDYKKIKIIADNSLKKKDFHHEPFFETYIKITTWKEDKYNKILKAIADDALRLLFICPSKKRIIAPYDGGVDVIMESETKRNTFKIKYKNWLSKREDGL